ncbi:hypothetical protein PGTUg99_033968 [Puccinia graminis f. sp. tritici]|uniref:Uncharacterized protein n=1 Tax=Puccinia graminis f. sp. tritici TaxID=56615 RepID=A0A5B0QS58_PUCGR|nr:hypothetical protein PGTUg99_033968 [Puccinia graminis f. sp. tritici]
MKMMKLELQSLTQAWSFYPRTQLDSSNKQDKAARPKEHLQQSRDWAIFSPNQRLEGEFWGPAEPQVDPQLIAPHLAPGYKSKAIAALAETGYSILTVFLTTHNNMTTTMILN